MELKPVSVCHMELKPVSDCHTELKPVSVCHMELRPTSVCHMELKPVSVFHKFMSLPYRRSCLNSIDDMEVNSSSMISHGREKSDGIQGTKGTISIPCCFYGSRFNFHELTSDFLDFFTF